MRRLRCATMFALGAALLIAGGASARAVEPVRCPGGIVRLGVAPAEDALTMTEVYKPVSEELGRLLGCPVELSITTSYSAAIEAMRAKKLDVASLGPLTYVLAHRIANAEAIVVQGYDSGKPIVYTASIVTPRGSGITRLREVAGHSFAFSDPASTSGHLLPSYALLQAGIDPNTGVRPYFAGSHTASFEALRNHKVDAGEMNSAIVRVATASGEYDPAAFITLWRSEPIPGSPVVVRGDLPPEFKARVRAALLGVRLSAIADPKRVFSGTRYVAVKDSAYDGIRSMVSTLHVDLEHINE